MEKSGRETNDNLMIRQANSGRETNDNLVICLVFRLVGEGFQDISLAVGERIDFTDLDIVCWGGCSDRESELAAKYRPF